jgi:hypothetical protein
MTIVSASLTFPDIKWWMQMVHAQLVIFDVAENFQKMTFRNRYRISGANNPILLTVPLVQGRNQHTPMKEVEIYNQSKWQTQHWRTLISVYKRSPFFDHYEPSLAQLFELPFTNLTDFNSASVQWVKTQLKLNFEERVTDEYLAEYPIEVIDFRRPDDITAHANLPVYHQLFEDRIGFQSNLSILDLLFSEGPHTANILRG